MIRRHSINKLVRLTHTVSSCFRPVPARSSGKLFELTNFAIRIFGEMRKKHCLQVCLLVFGLLDLSVYTGTSDDSSSELTLISSGVFYCGSTAECRVGRFL